MVIMHIKEFVKKVLNHFINIQNLNILEYSAANINFIRKKDKCNISIKFLFANYKVRLTPTVFVQNNKNIIRQRKKPCATFIHEHMFYLTTINFTSITQNSHGTFHRVLESAIDDKCGHM